VESRTRYGCLVRIYAAEELPPAMDGEVVVGSEDFADGPPFFSDVSLVIPSRIRSVFPTSGSELIPGNSSSHRPNVSASGSTTTCRISFSDAEAAIDLSSSSCHMRNAANSGLDGERMITTPAAVSTALIRFPGYMLLSFRRLLRRSCSYPQVLRAS